MVETKRAVTDPSLLLDNLIAKRHDPTAPSPQAVADEAEHRRRAQRRGDETATKRALWRAHHERLAENFAALAEQHRDRARHVWAGMTPVDQPEHKAEAVDALLDAWSVVSEGGGDPKVILAAAVRSFDRREYLIAGLQAKYEAQKFMQGGRSTASG